MSITFYMSTRFANVKYRVVFAWYLQLGPMDNLIEAFDLKTDVDFMFWCICSSLLYA